MIAVVVGDEQDLSQVGLARTVGNRREEVNLRIRGQSLQRLVANPTIDLLATIPHGTGQTYLREILLVADHNGYHIGQIVALRRRLGIWQS